MRIPDYLLRKEDGFHLEYIQSHLDNTISQRMSWENGEKIKELFTQIGEKEVFCDDDVSYCDVVETTGLLLDVLDSNNLLDAVLIKIIERLISIAEIYSIKDYYLLENLLYDLYNGIDSEGNYLYTDETVSSLDGYKDVRDEESVFRKQFVDDLQGQDSSGSQRECNREKNNDENSPFEPISSGGPHPNYYKDDFNDYEILISKLPVVNQKNEKFYHIIKQYVDNFPFTVGTKSKSGYLNYSLSYLSDMYDLVSKIKTDHNQKEYFVGLNVKWRDSKNIEMLEKNIHMPGRHFLETEDIGNNETFQDLSKRIENFSRKIYDGVLDYLYEITLLAVDGSTAKEIFDEHTITVDNGLTNSKKGDIEIKLLEFQKRFGHIDYTNQFHGGIKNNKEKIKSMIDTMIEEISKEDEYIKKFLIKWGGYLFCFTRDIQIDLNVAIDRATKGYILNCIEALFVKLHIYQHLIDQKKVYISHK